MSLSFRSVSAPIKQRAYIISEKIPDNQPPDDGAGGKVEQPKNSKQ